MPYEIARGVLLLNSQSSRNTGKQSILEYRSNKFIVGIDTEKLLGLSFNARNNLVTVRLKTETGANQADRMHIILLAEQIVELADAGALVYD